jgi:hypothetical protein
MNNKNIIGLLFIFIVLQLFLHLYLVNTSYLGKYNEGLENATNINPPQLNIINQSQGNPLDSQFIQLADGTTMSRFNYDKLVSIIKDNTIPVSSKLNQISQLQIHNPSINAIITNANKNVLLTQSQFNDIRSAIDNLASSIGTIIQQSQTILNKSQSQINTITTHTNNIYQNSNNSNITTLQNIQKLLPQ